MARVLINHTVTLENMKLKITAFILTLILFTVRIIQTEFTTKLQINAHA